MREALLDVDLPGLRRRGRGKVREIFELDGGLLLVATDRLSAFDVILNQGIPGRGIVLTRLSEFWFRRLEAICPNHLLSTDVCGMPEAVRAHEDLLAGRAMYVRELEIIPVECVVRGYLAGGGWKEYRSTGSVSGVALPDGLQESERLPEPVFTPSTKASQGHDLPMTISDVERLVGGELARELRETSLRLYEAGARHAAGRGVLLADTKFEFGVYDGRLMLADEAFTPDSSRYWDAASYEPGRPQDSYDKQIVRDWLESSGWDKRPPPPDLPEEVVRKAARRYEEIAERLMG